MTLGTSDITRHDDDGSCGSTTKVCFDGNDGGGGGVYGYVGVIAAGGGDGCTRACGNSGDGRSPSSIFCEWSLKGEITLFFLK